MAMSLPQCTNCCSDGGYAYNENEELKDEARRAVMTRQQPQNTTHQDKYPEGAK
jgi:hypothetical protein